MYNNLEIEMVRYGVTRKTLAKLLGVRYATVVDKLRGKYGFTLDEAFQIRDNFFPSLSLEYLFEKGERVAKDKIGFTYIASRRRDNGIG